MHIGVGAPKNYSVLVERFALVSQEDGIKNMEMGRVNCCWKGPHGPVGKGGPIGELPDYIVIRWYSLSEQKSYQKSFHLPDGLQQQIAQPAIYRTSKGEFQRPRDILTIGLAPGGTIVLWIMNQIGNEIEVARFQANEIDGDPSRYKAATEQYLEENGDYLDEHGIPKTGW
ncbi:DUF2931 family protein [Marinobacter sp. JSM 1782161]|uniref:DUF2931 family protein n=1 Tax=Marinobacter sp. JSM 1782161 TaxID=2685906 RepID=UPI001D196FC6|nr:DUF2931 family protein [Marinobacter sp. JSM 1782161]